MRFVYGRLRTFTGVLAITFAIGGLAMEATAGTCTYDFDPDPLVMGDPPGDGDVDMTEVIRIICAFGPCADCPEDVDNTGNVDAFDLLLVLGDFGCGIEIPPLTDTFTGAGSLEWEVIRPVAGPGLTVFRLYAVPTDPSERLAYVYDAQITPSTGAYWQSPFGLDTPPTAALVDVFPELEWDSFVTFTLTQDGDPDPDTTSTSPGFLSGLFNAPAGGQLSGGWFAEGCGELQGVPDVNGRVLVAQLSLEPPAPDAPVSITGSLLIGWRDDGELKHQRLVVNVRNTCPSDVNRDGVVDIRDLLAILGGGWGQPCP